MSESEIEKYYNKFNEDKRLLSRHGIVEYTITMKYIHDLLKEFENPKIIDVGAGTGRYSVALANEGYDVTAIELVKSNLGTLKAKKSSVKAYLGNALDLSIFSDNSFDITLELGPMYHVFSNDEKIKILNEAKRITKPNGYVVVGYYMNEYAVIMHGFVDGYIKEAIINKEIDENFHCISKPKNLYEFIRVDEINNLNHLCNLDRYKIVAVDGPTDYMRPIINKMDEETFNLFIKYQLSICEREELLGASSHLIDILKK